MASPQRATHIGHVFVKTGDDDEKSQAVLHQALFKDSVAIVVVGTTGTGKSSLIKLFCVEAKVGKSTTSETTSSHIFRENDSRSWLDSQGANDSNGVNDQKVLTDVLRELYVRGINKIKVIWCVSGDMDRKKAEFQTQAQFIKTGLGARDDAIWRCCLIVKKEGRLVPKRRMEGVLDAAKDQGCDITYGDKRLMGFSYFDPEDPERYMTNALENVLDSTEPGSALREAMLKNGGFLTSDVVRAEINARLSALDTLRIDFTIQQCSKCGSKGDPRFVYEPCHTEKEHYHPKDTTPQHPGTLLNLHPGKILKRHAQPLTNKHAEAEPSQSYHVLPGVRKVHTGTVESGHKAECKSIMVHPQKATYTCHRGDLVATHPKPLAKHHPVNKTEMYHPGSVEETRRHTGVFWVYMCNAIHDDYYKCCGAKGEKSLGCEVTLKYSCCSKAPNSEGCAERYVYCHCEAGSTGCQELYECCEKKEGAVGCQQTYECCPGKGVGSAGCQVKHRCCDALKGSAGCTKAYSCGGAESGCVQRYSCCSAAQGAEGCAERYACCDQGKDSDGCPGLKRFTCCGATEEKGQKAIGCTQSYACCGGDASAEGCESKFTCCDGAEDSAGCKSEYSCCGARESNSGCEQVHKCCNMKLGARGCKERCQSCHNTWGGLTDAASGDLIPNGCLPTTTK